MAQDLAEVSRKNVVAAMAPPPPTFDKAREMLADLFDNWVFSTVKSPCQIPTDAFTDDGRATHYYGNAEERTPVSTSGQRRRVFFSKQARMSDGFWIGPALASTMDTSPPQVGDTLIGMAVVNDRPSKAGRTFGGLRYDTWQCGTRQAWELARLIFVGTSQPEPMLKQTLRTKTPGGEDELWAIARLILFGNVEAFSPDGPATMALRKPASAFVHECAVRFGDQSIWTTYTARFPHVKPPVSSHANHTTNTKGGGLAEPPVIIAPVKRRPKQQQSTDRGYQGFQNYQQEQQELLPDVLFKPPALIPQERSPYHQHLQQHQHFQPHSPPPQDDEFMAPVSPPYLPVSPPYLPSTPPEEMKEEELPPPPPPLNIQSLNALLHAYNASKQLPDLALPPPAEVKKSPAETSGTSRTSGTFVPRHISYDDDKDNFSEDSDDGIKIKM